MKNKMKTRNETSGSSTVKIGMKQEVPCSVEGSKEITE